MSKGSAGSGEGGGNRSKGGSKQSAAAKRNPKRKGGAKTLNMSDYSKEKLGTPF